MQELIHRDGLRIALAGRDDVLLQPVLQFLVKYVTDPRFGELTCSIASIVIGTPTLTMVRPFLSNIPPYAQTCIHVFSASRRLLTSYSSGYARRLSMNFVFNGNMQK